PPTSTLFPYTTLFRSGGPTGASGVIFTSVGPNNNMQIVNNRFSGFSAAAVWMNRGGSDITINRNVMDGSNLAGGGQVIFGNGPRSEEHTSELQSRGHL